LRCTLFSPVVDRQAIESVRNILSGWSLDLEGQRKILLGTSGYFWRRDDLSASTKKDILRFVGGTRWLVGIVGTLAGRDLSEDVFLEAALELARRLGGKLFTGTEFITSERRG
jgi:hypothetical protein